MSKATPSTRIRCVAILGTRPEAIKLIPLVQEARRRADEFEMTVISTGQHRELLDGVFEDFGMAPDLNLDLMTPDQTPASVLTRAIDALSPHLSQIKPDCVFVQGDTMTTLAGALAASYLKIPIAHIEAGLRSFDRANPWPEETNRCLVTQVADFHFAPTETSRSHLLQEGVDPDSCWITGNTGIDALKTIVADHEMTSKEKSIDATQAKTILLTCHRRENFGAPMKSICDAVVQLLETFPHLNVLCPMHPNPQARSVMEDKLSAHSRVRLVEAMSYAGFAHAMAESALILTDSGGVQEEAPSLGRPVLVLRETTERPEAVEAGVAVLVGTDSTQIFTQAKRLLEDHQAYAAMARIENPFGDGHASQRILDLLQQHLALFLTRNS